MDLRVYSVMFLPQQYHLMQLLPLLWVDGFMGQRLRLISVDLKRKLHVVIAGFIAFSLGCFGFQIAGMSVAISTGIGDFTAAMGALGLLFLAFLAAFFCLWTTQDKDIYAGSLALQNIFNDTKLAGKVKHKHNALAIATIAAIFAALGIYSYIMPIIQYLAILIPPFQELLLLKNFL